MGGKGRQKHLFLLDIVETEVFLEVTLWFLEVWLSFSVHEITDTTWPFLNIT